MVRPVDSFRVTHGSPEQHSVGAQAFFSGHPNAASHHFKSVPCDYFADRLMYLVLWFLRLHLTERGKEQVRGNANTG